MAAGISAVVLDKTGTQKTDVPQTMAFTATPTGANGTVHYQWQTNINSAGYTNVGTDSNTYTITSAVGNVGTVLVKVIAWDAGDNHTNFATGLASTATTILIAAAMVVTITPALAQDIVVGETIHCAVTVAGGAANKTYQWYQDEVTLGAGAQNATYDYTPSTVAVHAIECAVTDDATVPVTVESEDTAVTVHSFYTMMAGAAGYLAKIAKSCS